MQNAITQKTDVDVVGKRFPLLLWMTGFFTLMLVVDTIGLVAGMAGWNPLGH